MPGSDLAARSRARGVRIDRRGPGRAHVHGPADAVRGDLARWIEEEVRSWCREVRDVRP